MSIKTTLKINRTFSPNRLFAYTSHAQAEGKLTVYCSVQNVVCEKLLKPFSKIQRRCTICNVIVQALY